MNKETKTKKNDDQEDALLLNIKKSSNTSSIKLKNSKMILKNEVNNNNGKSNSKVAVVHSSVNDEEYLESETKDYEVNVNEFREDRRRKRNRSLCSTDTNDNNGNGNSNSNSTSTSLFNSNVNSSNSTELGNNRELKDIIENIVEKDNYDKSNVNVLDSSSSIVKTKNVESELNEEKDTINTIKEMIDNGNNIEIKNNEEEKKKFINDNSTFIRKRKSRRGQSLNYEPVTSIRRTTRKCARSYRDNMFFQEENIEHNEESNEIIISNGEVKVLEKQKNLSREIELNSSDDNICNEKELGEPSTKLNITNVEGVEGDYTGKNVLNGKDNLCRKGYNINSEKSSHYFCNVLGNDVLVDTSEKPLNNHNKDIDKSSESNIDNSILKSNDNLDYSMLNNSEQKKEVALEDITVVGHKKVTHGHNKGKKYNVRKKLKGNSTVVAVNADILENNTILNSSKDSNVTINEENKEDNLIRQTHERKTVVPHVEVRRRGRKKKTNKILNYVINLNTKQKISENKNITSICTDENRGRKDDVYRTNSIAFDLDSQNTELPQALQNTHENLTFEGNLKVDNNNSSSSINKTNIHNKRRKLRDEQIKDDYEYNNTNSDCLLRSNIVRRRKYKRGKSRNRNRSRSGNKSKRDCEVNRSSLMDMSFNASSCKGSSTVLENVDKCNNDVSGRYCSSNNNNNNNGTHRNNSVSHNNRDSDSTSSTRRLFPNETFQIKEEFLNNVNSLNTVFNFNEEFVRFLQRVSQFEDIDYDTMLSFLNEIQIKLTNTIKQEFSNECFDSHNIEKTVYTMRHVVDIINNNNEILNKLNQLEYKFYYDYLRNRSAEGVTNNFCGGTENNIAINISRIPRNINNECCAKIQRNNEDSPINIEEDNTEHNKIDDEEARKLNELLHCRNNKETDDAYIIPNCTNVRTDVYFMNYNDENDCYRLNEAQMLNLSNTCDILNNVKIEDMYVDENDERTNNESNVLFSSEEIRSQPLQKGGDEHYERRSLNKSTDYDDRDEDIEKDVDDDDNNEDVCLESRKITNWNEREAEEEAANRIRDDEEYNEIARKINDLQKELNTNRRNFQNEHAHKLIYQNNVDFVCDELNRLIKQTLKSEDLYYSNFSKGRYRNVTHRSLYRNYISSKLYRSNSNYMDICKEENMIGAPGGVGVAIRNSGYCRNKDEIHNSNVNIEDKVDENAKENEKTLMDNYANYFRRLNDINSSTSKSKEKEPWDNSMFSRNSTLDNALNYSCYSSDNKNNSYCSTRMLRKNEYRNKYNIDPNVVQNSIIIEDKTNMNYTNTEVSSNTGEFNYSSNEQKSSRNFKNSTILNNNITKDHLNSVDVCSRDEGTLIKGNTVKNMNDNLNDSLHNGSVNIRSVNVDSVKINIKEEKNDGKEINREVKGENEVDKDKRNDDNNNNNNNERSNSSSSNGVKKNNSQEDNKESSMSNVNFFFTRNIESSEQETHDNCEKRGNISNNNSNNSCSNSIGNDENTTNVLYTNLEANNKNDNEKISYKEMKNINVMKKVMNIHENTHRILEVTGEDINTLNRKYNETIIFDDLSRAENEELKNCCTLRNDSLDISDLSIQKEENEHYLSNEKDQDKNSRSMQYVLIDAKNNLNDTYNQNSNSNRAVNCKEDKECEITIDSLLKETFRLKDDKLMSLKTNTTQKEILDCLRMVSNIKKVFFDECTKMINDQIFALEKNFRIPNCSLSILKNSFGYNEDI
ncbi:hypothetical protein PMALA_023610 [Plasmodium malariae]|uniref:Uncharacterized protein n=1 Tax=Plasmodium malariae TaxID=5858 RepID=A0A1A8WBY6_PLAMA|nr:hypothetical protein PMALA_023610 [Plasmodium malariae]